MTKLALSVEAWVMLIRWVRSSEFCESNAASLSRSAFRSPSSLALASSLAFVAAAMLCPSCFNFSCCSSTTPWLSRVASKSSAWTSARPCFSAASSRC